MHSYPGSHLPRLDHARAEEMYKRIKQLPRSTPANQDKFYCLLEGCPGTYFTKQGLERHFISIHMPKDMTMPKRQTLQRAASTLAPTRVSHKRRMAPSGRPRGRPPRSGRGESSSSQGRKNSLDDILDAYNEEMQPVPEKETHPISQNHQSGHDYGMDDDHKPREERSYQEFFPFLDPAMRLTIVDITKPKVTDASVGSSAPQDSNQVHAQTLPIIKEEDTRGAGQGHKHSQEREPNHEHSGSAESDSGMNGVTVGVTEQPAGTHPVPEKEDVKESTQPTTDIVSQDATSSSDQEQEEFFDVPGSLASESGSVEPTTMVKDEPRVNGGHSATETPHQETVDTPDMLPSQNPDGSPEEPSAMDIDHPETKDETRVVENQDTEMGEQPLTPAAKPDAGVDREQEQNEGQGKNRVQIQDASNNESPLPTPEPRESTEQMHILSSGAEPPLVKIAHQHPLSSMVLEPKTPISSLPKSNFRKIPREIEDVEVFHMPSHFMRYIEPTEMDLADRVEYDMDEQDQFWLQAINEERRKDDLVEVSANTFEKIIDRLEKEWFDLTKNIPKTQENLPPEDSACNICDDGECENSNAIVFCDGCNLAVHQDCYGIPYIPEGQWLCRKCMLSPQMPVSCIFCPGEGGAFKQTTNNRWAHLLCANWIPEVGVANTVYMEPIDNIDKIPVSRWRLTCYICKLRVGACIQCETKNCFRAFHVTCARKAHLYMKSRLSRLPGGSGEVLTYRAHCHKHTPRDYKDRIDIAGAAALFANRTIKKRRKKIDEDSDDPDFGMSEDEVVSPRAHRKSSIDSDASAHAATAASQAQGSRASKAALAHQKHYAPGAPLAPSYIVQRLVPYCSKLGGKAHAARMKYRFLYTICKYWSLKRESRRGAPLLKRLHLEPWTASASAHRQTEEEKMKKLQTLLTLRGDLEKVRMLAELVRKRERAKLKRQEYQNRYLGLIFFPLRSILEDVLTELEKLDRQKYFHFPISEDEVKDYHEIIKNPISFQDMREKLEGFQYNDIETFAEDARRIYENCMTYNQADTTYYRAASRQAKIADTLLQKAAEDYAAMDVDPVSGFLRTPIDPEIFSYTLDPFPTAGDEVEEVDVDDTDGGSSALATETVTPEGTPVPEIHEKRSHKKKKAKEATPAEDEPSTVASLRSLRNTRSAIPATSTTTSTALSTSRKSGEKRSILDKKMSLTSPTNRPLAGAAAATTTTAASGLATARGSSGSSSSISTEDTVSKSKPHTMTRSEAARAREQHLQIENEEDLLEKLKKRSEKSRKVAANLQSRLKPSIVDKAVVINKPAPKGWAYVVVEGEESDEEEDEVEAGAAGKKAEENGVDEGQSKEAKSKNRPAPLKRQRVPSTKTALTSPTAEASSAAGSATTKDSGSSQPKPNKRPPKMTKAAKQLRQKAANLLRKEKYWAEKRAREAALAAASAAAEGTIIDDKSVEAHKSAISSGTSNMETLAAVAEAVARAELSGVAIDHQPLHTAEEALVKVEADTGSSALPGSPSPAPAVAQVDSDTEMADAKEEDQEQPHGPTTADEGDEESEVDEADEEEKASEANAEDQEDQEEEEADSDDDQDDAQESDRESASNAEESDAAVEDDEDAVEVEDDEDEEEDDEDEDEEEEEDEEAEDDEEEEAAADSDEAQEDAEESDRASVSDERDQEVAHNGGHNSAEESDSSSDEAEEEEDEDEKQDEDLVQRESGDDDDESVTSDVEQNDKEPEEEAVLPPPAKRQRRASDKAAPHMALEVDVDAAGGVAAPATNGRRRLRSSDSVGSPPASPTTVSSRSKGALKNKKGKGASGSHPTSLAQQPAVSTPVVAATTKGSKRRRSMS
ncbi:nuA3 HAT complex component nto1 [Actinomortierella ambigua]|nr:nuA3 HAT complex component nto1 [Actinomortierella ambigua]